MAKSHADKFHQAGIAASRGSITYVDPKGLKLIRDKSSPLYDPRVDEPLDQPADQLFIADIAENGVTNPVLVRVNGPDYEVVAGRRRVAATMLVNKKRATPILIPITVLTGSDEEMVAAAIRENALRKEESYYSQAWKVRSLQRLGLSNDMIARTTHLPLGRIDGLLNFLNLSAEAQAAIQRGELPFGSVPTLGEVKREEQPAFVEELKKKGARKKHEVRAAVKAKREGKEYQAPERKKMWSRAEIEKLLEYLDTSSDAALVLRYILGDEKARTAMPIYVRVAITKMRRAKK